MHIAGFLKLPSSRDRATRQRKMGQWEAASWDIKQRGKERRLPRVGGYVMENWETGGTRV